MNGLGLIKPSVSESLTRLTAAGRVCAGQLAGAEPGALGLGPRRVGRPRWPGAPRCGDPTRLHRRGDRLAIGVGGQRGR